LPVRGEIFPGWRCVTGELLRLFVKLRRILSTHKELARKLNDLEKRYDHQFAVVFDAIRKLMEPPPVGKKRRIGFIVSESAGTD
jgi:hypothetical protein